MACEPPLPQKKPKSPPVGPTTICALGDDLLREIFLRLPSLPALFRAALTCRSSLRAVRSCPTFRRRFGELHSPPHLGLFINISDFHTPAFRPFRLSSDPDIAAVVRRADFFLTRLPNNDEGSALKWLIRDCRNGYVVLISQSTDHMAVYNPLTRVLDLFPKPPRKICKEMCVEFHVLSSEENPGQGALTAGQTKDGNLCIICAVKLTLVVWSWRADDDGIERWMLDKTFPLLPAVDALTDSPADNHDLKILAIVNGFVYLSIYYKPARHLSGWFLSFCLETAKLNKLCPMLHHNSLSSWHGLLLWYLTSPAAPQLKLEGATRSDMCCIIRMPPEAQKEKHMFRFFYAAELDESTEVI
uniref:Uncharacterized protein n=1 Tax=Avena sativa TaxID=4498 RepID=A0ACD5TN52_AVESA